MTSGDSNGTVWNGIESVNDSSCVFLLKIILKICVIFFLIHLNWSIVQFGLVLYQAACFTSDFPPSMAPHPPFSISGFAQAGDR